MVDMQYDCGFDIGNYHYRFRAGGLLVKDGKILFVKTKFGDYYYVVGGGVKLGESTEAAIIREFAEETSIQADIKRLAVVCENFFDGHGGIIEGKDCHTLEFYYLLSTKDDVNKIPTETDEGEKLVWIPIENIEIQNIKPDFIKKSIREILDNESILHVIEKSDKSKK